MDIGNGDSDHSMTWEDFFGSTTDLTPTLIGIYDSLLEPKTLKPEVNSETAKDARNDPPVESEPDSVTLDSDLQRKDLDMSTGSVKLPIATINKSSLYTLRGKSDKIGAIDTDKCDRAISETVLIKDKPQRTLKDPKHEPTFDSLSPNVKRIISSATEASALKFQKKTTNVARSSTRLRSNIPLVGATSKITQSGLEILDSVEIYDQPCLNKAKIEESVKPETKVEAEETYDVPMNNRPAIYDVPSNNKTAFETLSLPFIDQSIELSITTNDREFDIKLSSKETSPMKSNPKTSTPEGSPAKVPKLSQVGTNSLHRKDFLSPPKQLSETGPYPDVVGSTGNLKSCSVQDKDVSRLNPPVIEVCRPLSMSSIASSSSTSSSGVQNKGVNSAYLASIESLDDHSDVDITSANGSNNYVNKAGIMNNSVSERNSDGKPRQLEETSGLSQLERVCAEIVQTENVYVEDLRQVVEGYLHIWRRDVTFSEEELSELFNNIEDIFNFNRSLCEELNTCRLDATCIARCFVNNTSGFSVYTSYCTGYPRTMQRLAALASKPQSAREFRERQTALGHPLPLASYLLKPVQRILKYHLLLQNVVKQCASSETEYALVKMTGIAQHIDDMKRRHEHAVRVQEIQSLLYGWSGPDLTTYGELCAEGTFRVFGAKAMRHAFLFDKMLLVTKNREDGILAYKSHIMCNNMMLVESISGAPLSFHVIPWDAPRCQLTLQARSARHKREWTLLLKRVILENYNAVIPSHARQLVMELGQNRTDDDMLAEKSHNLITQASMRKQLSAPEYLEKRKLERERRKCFESGARGRLAKANRKYTTPSARSTRPERCDCTQISNEKGTDYTCEFCYVDVCTDCEVELGGKDKRKNDENDSNGDKCSDCDALQSTDAGSSEHLERRPYKRTDFNSSQESFVKENLNKAREYHSTNDIVSYADAANSAEDLRNSSLSNIKSIPKTSLKCELIKENIAVDASTSLIPRPSRSSEIDKHRTDTLRSKSKEDPNRSKLTKISGWRRKSEPGLQQNTISNIAKRTQEGDSDRTETRGGEKIEFECRNCGSNKITRRLRANDGTIISNPELEPKKRGANTTKPNLEIRMYNTKNVPKKITKIKKNRAKGLRVDTTARFYADLSADASTENILHISESNDSLNVDKSDDKTEPPVVTERLSKDEDIDEETYKKLIEKTDSFKKNELEKVKYLNKQKVINESSEVDEKTCDETKQDVVVESGEETEQPLEQIISQLLLQNREFQKLIKKQQLRNSAQRRHQRLLKSHSNPEPVVLARQLDNEDNKFKLVKQNSERNDTKIDEDDAISQQIPEPDQVETKEIEEDHIYETLRIDSRFEDALHNVDNKSKSIHHQHLNRQKRLPSPPAPVLHKVDFKSAGSDLDYVYLTFNKGSTDDFDGIYDVPVKSPQKVPGLADEYYVPMDKPLKATNENIYDTLVEVCKRKKDLPAASPGDYLPMGPDRQSPNTPEIWLSRQKEHFNVSRDRKSGSLPRSFQVVTGAQEDSDLASFKCKPYTNSKTYLNREGKVVSIDRPFTIASDQSEISYDDVESYMSEGDILKFNKNAKTETEYAQDISQSTLELEEEIDRCYKNNFEDITLDKTEHDDPLDTSQNNLNNISTTSSCEALQSEKSSEKPTNTDPIHPEHRIYKPVSNILSLRNVLSRFKSKTPNKSSNDEDNNNDQSVSDPKSPSNEKRSALNPRSYSKNLLQRFRSIIGDEHTDDNQNRTDPPVTKLAETVPTTTDVKVAITTTIASGATSTAVTDVLSKSVCEQTSTSQSQNVKNNLEALSYSCENIPRKPDKSRPKFEKSVSMVAGSVPTASPFKSKHSSYQSLNKLPVYMQGSKHLGARIAHSDYVDPMTLSGDRSALKNVNVLLNKNSVRPDSLFSNSSYVTTSSDGIHQSGKSNSTDVNLDKPKVPYDTIQDNSDECFYEKHFEKIEHVIDGDVFRDSAVYSDQEEVDEAKSEPWIKDKKPINKIITRVESVQRKSSLQRINLTKTETIQTVNKDRNPEQNSTTPLLIKRKIAPPVPVKPKITQIPTAHLQNRIVTRNLTITKEVDLVNIAKTSSHIRKPIERCVSTPAKDISEDKLKGTSEVETVQPTNIQIKRLSFERASLDSASRKLRTNDPSLQSEAKTSNKSVLERRLEIERLSKTQMTPIKIPVPPIPAHRSFDRSISERMKNRTTGEIEKDIPVNKINYERTDSDDVKGSWVKQVVNKFQ